MEAPGEARTSLVRDQLGPAFDELRPLKEGQSTGFPVYPDLVEMLAGSRHAERAVQWGSGWGGLFQRAESRYAREGVETDDLVDVVGRFVDRRDEARL